MANYVSLFDALSDDAITLVEFAVRRVLTGAQGPTEIELENFANSCRSELQHRAAEKDLVGVVV